MTEFVLTATYYDQVVERDDQGRAVRVVKHQRGAIIEGLGREDAARLLAAGAIEPAAGIDHGGPLAAGADLPAATSSPDSGAPVEDNAPGVPTGVLERPRSAAAKSIWESYAAARGVDVAGLGKDEIIAAVDALDQQ